MDYEKWALVYQQILDDFSFREGDDINAAEILAALLKDNDFPKDELERFINGKTVVVVGDSDKEKMLPNDLAEHTVIAADGATKLLVKWKRMPDIIVTDLDGNLRSQKEANRKGALIIVHAHGDNIGRIKNINKWFKGEIMGTCQCAPPPELSNYGGFTDGDRAVFIADALGASKIILYNFDFENPAPREGKDLIVKKKKLQWAKTLIAMIETPVEIR